MGNAGAEAAAVADATAGEATPRPKGKAGRSTSDIRQGGEVVTIWDLVPEHSHCSLDPYAAGASRNKRCHILAEGRATT